MQTFTAVLHIEDDMYVAECQEVGTVSQGSTLEEAINNLKEATELYLEEFPLEVLRWLTLPKLGFRASKVKHIQSALFLIFHVFYPN